jgi:hypothetical protein
MQPIPYLPSSEYYGQVEYWSPNPKPKFRLKRIVKYVEPVNEAVEILTEWYTSKGLPVPAEELEACKQSLEPVLIASASVKPVYGTPEFWKEWWRKKKAKDCMEK